MRGAANFPFDTPAGSAAFPPIDQLAGELYTGVRAEFNVPNNVSLNSTSTRATRARPRRSCSGG